MDSLPKRYASDSMPGSPVSPPVLPPLSTPLPPSAGRESDKEGKLRSLAEILMDDGVEVPRFSTQLPPSRAPKYQREGTSKSLTEILMGDGGEEGVISDIEMSSSSEREARDVVTVNCRRAGFKSKLLSESIEVGVTQGSRLQDVWFKVYAGSSHLRRIGYKKLTKEVEVCSERAETRDVFHVEHFVRDLPAGVVNLVFIVEENQRTREAIVRGDLPVSRSAPLPVGYGILSGARSKSVAHVGGQRSRDKVMFSRETTPSSSRFQSGPPERRGSFQPAYPYHHEGDRNEFSCSNDRSREEDDLASNRAVQGHYQGFRRPKDNRSVYGSPYVRHRPEVSQKLPYFEPFADSMQDHVPSYVLDGSNEFRHSATLPIPIPMVEEDLRMREADRHSWSFIHPHERWSFRDHLSRLPY